MQFTLTSLPLYEILSRICMAAFLGLLAAVFHVYLSRGQSSTRFFFSAQVLIAIIVATMMIAIDERLPRALGLFASLSIVRFRMPIKSLMELVFIFLSVAIGICAGTGAFRIAIVGVTFGLLTLLFISVFREHRFFGSEGRILEVTLGDGAPNSADLENLNRALSEVADRYSESENRSFGGVFGKVFEVWVGRGTSDEKLIQDIQGKVPGLKNIRVIRLFNADEAAF